MKRRRFLQLLLFTVAGLAAAGAGLLRRAAPRRVLRAWRGSRYPGPVRPLDEDQVRQAGPWAG